MSKRVVSTLGIVSVEDVLLSQGVVLESPGKGGGRDLVAVLFLESSPVTVGPDCASMCRGPDTDRFCSH